MASYLITTTLYMYIICFYAYLNARQWEQLFNINCQRNINVNVKSPISREQTLFASYLKILPNRFIKVILEEKQNKQLLKLSPCFFAVLLLSLLFYQSTYKLFCFNILCIHCFHVPLLLNAHLFVYHIYFLSVCVCVCVFRDGCRFLRSKPDLIVALFALTSDPSIAIVKDCYYILINLSADETLHKVRFELTVAIHY